MSDKEREYISDDEAWQIFVGIASPEEVLRHHESIDEAINSILWESEWDEPVPSWLGDSLRRCFERVHGDELNQSFMPDRSTPRDRADSQGRRPLSTMTQPSNALYNGDVSGPQETLALRLSALRQEKDWCNRNGYPDVPSVDEAISVVEAMSGEMDRRIGECISALIEEWMASDSEDVRDIAESLKDEDWPSLAV